MIMMLCFSFSNDENGWLHLKEYWRDESNAEFDKSARNSIQHDGTIQGNGKGKVVCMWLKQLHV